MAHGGADHKPPRPFTRVELNYTTWEVPDIYQNLSHVGAGAYGQVCSAFDRVLNRKVAIKKLKRPFESVIDAKRTYREINMLKHMNHANIIGLLDIFTPATTLDDFKDIYLVTQLMATDLKKIIEKQTLSDDQVCFLVYQMLCGLKYLHSTGIIHRDIKLENCAVDADIGLRILDFGLARQQGSEMTGYVATRWYRAPEILLNWMHYNESVDVWSVGCIMAELLTNRTLFPGTDYMDQLTQILQLVGTPGPKLLDKMTSSDARKYIESLPKMAKADFKKYFAGSNPIAIDLLERMLDLDPDTRISAEDALAHPYLKTFHDPTDEPIAEPYDKASGDKNYEIPVWKEMCFKEVLSFVPEAFLSLEDEVDCG